jgi:hypothetical protein
MVWSLYFWLGALMTKVTGLSTVPESIAHITTMGGWLEVRARNYLWSTIHHFNVIILTSWHQSNLCQ